MSFLPTKVHKFALVGSVLCVGNRCKSAFAASRTTGRGQGRIENGEEKKSSKNSQKRRRDGTYTLRDEPKH